MAPGRESAPGPGGAVQVRKVTRDGPRLRVLYDTRRPWAMAPDGTGRVTSLACVTQVTQPPVISLPGPAECPLHPARRSAGIGESDHGRGANCQWPTDQQNAGPGPHGGDDGQQPSAPVLAPAGAGIPSGTCPRAALNQAVLRRSLFSGPASALQLRVRLKLPTGSMLQLLIVALGASYFPFERNGASGSKP